MDALDEQLAQLKLMNSRSLSPRQNLLIGPNHESPKKVGPAVPPKPSKKNSPQVPQSSAVKQLCEPNYSKRLQTDSASAIAAAAAANTTGDRVSPLPKTTNSSGDTLTSSTAANKKSGNTLHHVYSNMKMTLDNPAILEQQLEALEHHKKQLEKKGMLPVSSKKLPILSSGSAVNGAATKNSHVYSNVPHTKNDKGSDIVYSNILHHNKIPQPRGTIVGGGDIVYSNVGFENAATGAGAATDELPPPPPIDNIPVPLTLTDPSTLEYLNQTSEDELPPPPSPVSSSYSELRRATDNFPQLPSYPMQSYSSVAGSIHSAHSQIGINDSTDPGTQQTYINTSYHNDYSTYGPSSQSTPNSSEYYGYGSLSQGSSTYESIYEPINPRPPSQLSSRSNYSLYTSYVNGPQSAGSGTPVGIATSCGSSGKLSSHKEAEVEALTDLLVHSMGSGADVDTYGICVKCGERVVGENSGCTAMEQIYHIACFTCSQCQINLQGKPFYALEGKPYCEEDYLNTLEKCSVCMKPILERILRATGKPYHPQCFCCVVCGNSLDGIPFTVDATNQNYCIEDFHKKFAPRCCVCRQPIMPEPGQEETVRVVALDRSFHFECYKCEDCGLLLSSEAEGRGCYPLDDHVLCKSCNARRVQALTNRMTTEL